MLTLLKVGAIYAPERLEETDILFADGRIAVVGRDLEPARALQATVVEARDLTAVPGFIDQHVHATGGGGEGGFHTRCPEIRAEQIVRRGITTVVGVLGTDSVSRTPADLLAKVRGLRAEGVDAYMYTGAYRLPPPTLTGDVQRDLCWIPEVLGVGEIAIADDRSSQPRQEEIERVVGDARVGGLLAGKRGICHFHLGDGARGLTALRDLLTRTELPAEQIIPTHVNRRRGLLEDAADYARTFDAPIDVTAFNQDDEAGDGGLSAYEAVRWLLAQGVPAARITLSSDCNGSLPGFDAQGAYVGMGVADNAALIRDWRRLVADGVVELETGLGLLSGTVARVLGLERRKGRIAAGWDADVTLLDGALEPRMVFAGGRCRWRAA